jgi:L-amino acid N-acyltransferase YncA
MLRVGAAADTDLEALTEIYNLDVMNTAITFDARRLEFEATRVLATPVFTRRPRDQENCLPLLNFSSLVKAAAAISNTASRLAPTPQEMKTTDR